MIHGERGFPVLPTLLTLGNAFCGFAAITYAARVGPEQVDPAGAHLQLAAMYIFAGMVFDALDGPIARWTRQQSEFGAQLDSLCDAVTFGIAPAFLFRQFSAHSFLHPRILWGIAALYVVCAILRLARFNLEQDDEDGSHDFFDGLPSLAAAATIASFPIGMKAVQRWLAPENERVSALERDIMVWLNSALVELLPLVTLAIACLMVSQFRYPHVFRQLFRGKRSRRHLIQVVFAVVIGFVIGELAITFICFWFVFATPVRVMSCRFALKSWRRRSDPVL